MNNTRLCWFNGELLPYRDLNLHISDLLIQRSYGVFDFFRTRNGELTWMDDYLDRFFNSMSLAGIENGISKKELAAVIRKLLDKNGMSNGAFKLMATGGYSETLEGVSGPSNLLVLNLPWKKPSQHCYDKGVNLISDHFIRPNPEIKSLYYMNSLRLRHRIAEYQAVDVLYHDEMISETSRANLFFVKGDRIYTPASKILRGVTRKQVLSLFKMIHVKDIPFSHLYEFDEVFLTSTSRDITPVVSIDGKIIGRGVPGEVTLDLMTGFKNKGW